MRCHLLWNHHGSWGGGGGNVCGFRVQHLPTNLHPHETIHNHLFHIYKNYPNYTINEIKSQRTRKKVTTH